MAHMIETVNLQKRFDKVVALAGVDLKIDGPNLVGLIGRNGSGKTTLFRHLVGLYLPSSGNCKVLGRPCGRLGRQELSRIGWVPQEHRFLDWMTVEQHVRYVAAQYDDWQVEREQRLREELELPADRRVGTLSSGEAQKLALVLALGHRPDLLLLDEPVSSLDPIVRGRLLAHLLELLSEQEMTVVVSSHVLCDIEKIVTRVVCLDNGSVTVDAELDELKEEIVEWRLKALTERLPERFDETFVLHQEIDGSQARLIVRTPLSSTQTFRARHGVDIQTKPLSLEEMFPYLVDEVRS